jgi:hypothetical protein
MRELLQIACVVALGLGAGLYATGGYLRPTFHADPTGFARSMSRNHDEERVIAAGLSGTGVGFMVLGALGLVVPWVNAALRQGSSPTAEPPRAGS